MFIMDLLCPLVMIAFGRRFINNPPKSVNSFYGYRTKMKLHGSMLIKLLARYGSTVD